MAEVTNAELQRQLTELHDSLIKGTAKVTVTYAKDPMDQLPGAKNPDGSKLDEEKLEKPQTIEGISKLKEALIAEAPRVVTDAMLPFDFVKRFADMYEELQKEPVTEYLEAMGLDGFAAAVEKNYEENKGWKAWLYSAIAGLFIPMLGAVIAIMFLTNFKTFQRGLQKLLFNVLLGWVPKLGPYLRDKIIAMEPDSRFPKLQRAEDVRNREGGNLAGVTLTNPPDPATFDALKRALGDINRRIINFNKAVAKMKSKAQLDKLAAGVEAVTKATDAAKPTDIETLATAIGKLGTAQDTFDPKKLPKARGLASAATEAERLAKAGDAVKKAFDELKAAASQAEAVIARS
ncbi:hypothetical protein [Streptomyces sp. NPDC015130]|uniref:hypothetical protein n=1 Tax=Streptomyces sp. NPDC015130 TaxID=3364940 RepID=UPI0036FFC6D3